MCNSLHEYSKPIKPEGIGYKLFLLWNSNLSESFILIIGEVPAK